MSARRGRQNALQLGEVVEGPLGEDDSLIVGGDRERAAGDTELAPERRVGGLVEDTDGDVRVVRDVLDRGREGLAEMAPLGAEDGESESPRAVGRRNRQA